MTCPVTAVIKEISDALAKLEAERHLAIQIPLKNKAGEVVATALLDDADAELAKLNWWPSGDGYGAGKNGLMHAAVMGKAPEGYLIDHRNGDRADNRRGNLRFVTASTNAQNCRRSKAKTSSKFTGVCFSEGFWLMVFKSKYVARYEQETWAAWAYNIKVFEEYGALGRYNDLEKPPGFVEKVKKAKVCKSRGVSMRHGLYVAHFWGDKKTVFLGSYKTEEEASRVYEDFRAKWYAEKERLHLAKEITRDEIGPYLMAGDTVIHVSESDWHMLTKHTWSLADGYPTATVMTKPKISVLPMHRYLLGKKKGFVIGHTDGDKTNNRRDNLAFVTYSINAQNKRSVSKTGWSGVWITRGGDYAAEIRKDGKKYGLGTYKVAEVAAYAYDMAAVEFYGPDAHVNGVDKPDGFVWDAAARRLKKV
jgi:HNH endonuclease